jgi:hypothetical protein
MGYAHYVLEDGREAGYAVPDMCNEEGCDEKIDRGLSYLCGDVPGGDEYGCGGYFCWGHLFIGSGADCEGQCKRCYERWIDEHPEVVEEDGES